MPLPYDFRVSATWQNLPPIPTDANFVLGPASVLGLDIALGRDNQPNTVLINLRLPESELSRTKYSPETYRQKMMEIVRTLVPAQVFFDVTCSFE